MPVVLEDQIQPGTFEFALDALVDHELDLSALDAKFKNDKEGASAAAKIVAMRQAQDEHGTFNFDVQRQIRIDELRRQAQAT